MIPIQTKCFKTPILAYGWTDRTKQMIVYRIYEGTNKVLPRFGHVAVEDVEVIFQDDDLGSLPILETAESLIALANQPIPSLCRRNTAEDIHKENADEEETPGKDNHQAESPDLLNEDLPENNIQVSAQKSDASIAVRPDDEKPESVVEDPKASKKDVFKSEKQLAKAENKNQTNNLQPNTNMSKSVLPDSLGRGKPRTVYVVDMDIPKEQRKPQSMSETAALELARNGANIKISCPNAPKWYDPVEYFSMRLKDKGIASNSRKS